MQEICITKPYHASCLEGSVITMSYAQYGRMDVGKCITSGQPNMGCSVDVISDLDAMCSGQRECSIDSPGAKLENSNPCQPGYSPFLKAAYNCIEGKPFPLPQLKSKVKCY